MDGKFRSRFQFFDMIPLVDESDTYSKTNS